MHFHTGYIRVGIHIIPETIHHIHTPFNFTYTYWIHKGIHLFVFTYNLYIRSGIHIIRNSIHIIPTQYTPICSTYVILHTLYLYNYLYLHTGYVTYNLYIRSGLHIIQNAIHIIPTHLFVLHM